MEMRRMQVINIPPDKLAEFETLQTELNRLNKSIEAIANTINATKPISRDMFLSMREMQKEWLAVYRRMIQLGGETADD
jgi:hypothetical protein